jgi:hypothetical protein
VDALDLDPVHLAVGLKGIRLTDPAALKLSAAEAAALGQALNAHFAPEGLTFQAPHPRRWYVRLPQGLAAPRTTAPEHALGPVEESSLPAGDAGARWRSCMNEAQMLLHEHPVNRAREQSGEPPINGVWLWGGGSPPAPAARPGTECWLAADPLVRGLALAAGARAANLPGTWSGRAPPGPGIHWHVLEQARAAAAAGDPQAWHAALMDLETHWFAPLLDALAQGSLGMVSIHAVSPGQTLSVEVTRSDLRHVWRRARALKAYVNLNAPAEAR